MNAWWEKVEGKIEERKMNIIIIIIIIIIMMKNR